MYLFTYMYMYVSVHMYTFMYMYKCFYGCVYIRCIYIYRYMRTCISIRIRICTFICVRAYVCV